MHVPKVAVALGIVLLLLSFAIGTWEPSTSVDGRSLSCGPAIDLTRLPFTGHGRETGVVDAPCPRRADVEAPANETITRQGPHADTTMDE